MRGLLAAVVIGAALFGASVAQAGTLSFAGGVVTYQASPGEPNHVFLISDSDGVVAVDLGAPVTAGTGCTSDSANAASCAFPPGVNRVEILAGDMSDYVNTAALELPNRIEGEAGNDELTTGGIYNLYSVMDGGPGADTFESVNGTVDYSDRTNPVTVTVGDDQANDGEAGENDRIPSGIGWVIGGGGNDHMSAGEVAEVKFKGGAGDDVLEAEVFAYLIGNKGDDRLLGGKDAQYIGGGSGADLLRGGPSEDSLGGGEGNDEIIGGLGADYMNGDDGNDTLRSHDGFKDRVNGDAGFDRAHGDALDVLMRIERLY